MPSLYLHTPFCARKCPYCDFYSLHDSAPTMDAYVHRLTAAMDGWGSAPMQTIYFGGGTPNLLGPERLTVLLQSARSAFIVGPDAEITLEANPTQVGRPFFTALRRAGFNRLSMGLQSANEDELRLLGRAHSPEDAARAVRDAQASGFTNISLDLMLGLPGGSREKLRRSMEFAAGLDVQHISAYILKIEPGTPFATQNLALPDEDESADQYLYTVEHLGRLGYGQYEISNFARPGFESRHNLTYWQGGEYLGLGPAAHSFWGSRRFYYPRDLQAFLDRCGPIDDGPGGSIEEFAMLNLRLTRGLLRADLKGKFGLAGEQAFTRAQQNARACPPHLLRADAGRLAFTPEGFLVSNALLVRLLSGL